MWKHVPKFLYFNTFSFPFSFQCDDILSCVLNCEDFDLTLLLNSVSSISHHGFLCSLVDFLFQSEASEAIYSTFLKMEADGKVQ